MIRVLVADDQSLVRSGIRAVIEADPRIEVVAEAADGAEAAALAAEHAADVVLMDVQMPGVDGIEGTRRTIRSRPEARILVLTMFDLDEHVLGALRAGASGFLLKSTSPEDLVAAVHGAHQGDQLFSPAITRRLVEAFVRRTPAGTEVLDALTRREREVFALVARGLANAEIARALFLGETTVKTHVARILAKLGLRDRVQVVVLAYEIGFLVPGDPDAGCGKLAP